jgi:hypothetical protein
LFAAVTVGALSVGAARAQQAGNSAQPLSPVEVTAKKSKTTKHKREAGATAASAGIKLLRESAVGRKTQVLQHRVTARFQVLNVTNRKYYVSIANGNIVGSPGANTAYLGTPQTSMASVSVDF